MNPAKECLFTLKAAAPVPGPGRWLRTSNIREYAPGLVISANELRAAFREAGLECSMDTLIAHWKGAGVISPRLSSMSSVNVHRSPLYELNPSVFHAA